MSALTAVLIGGPLGGLLLEAIGIFGTASRAGRLARLAGRALTLIHRMKAKLPDEDRAEAESLTEDAAGLGVRQQ